MRHQINQEQHGYLLEQGRQDPVTGELIQVGDEVVFCAACTSVFLADSWEYIGKKHCNQHKTLQYVPTIHDYTLKKRKNAEEFNYMLASFQDRIGAGLIDFSLLVCVFFLVGFITLLLSMLLVPILNSTQLISFLFMVPLLAVGMCVVGRDGKETMQSLGKRMGNMKVVHIKTGQKCSLWRAIIRNLLLPLEALGIVYWLLTGRSIRDVLTGTRVIKVKEMTSV